MQFPSHNYGTDFKEGCTLVCRHNQSHCLCPCCLTKTHNGQHTATRPGYHQPSSSAESRALPALQAGVRAPPSGRACCVPESFRLGQDWAGRAWGGREEPPRGLGSIRGRAACF